MKIPFIKMQGAGNDYIFIDCFGRSVPDPARLARAMSPRHFSVGGDGLVLICPSDTADAEMRMFNADGSEGKMCGNAIRCVGKYLYEAGIVSQTDIAIETRAGIRKLRLYPENGRVSQVAVEMGRAAIEPERIPIASPRPLLLEPLELDGMRCHITCLSVGNPHCVVPVNDLQRLELEQIGSAFERHPLFPERVNTEFVRYIRERELEMRVWERGSGETLACGTGACAAVAAGVLNGSCAADQPVTVHLRGGDLTITCSAELGLTMRGPAVRVYDGVFDDENPA